MALDIVAPAGILDRLPEQDRSLMTMSARTRHLRSGEILCAQGDHSHALHFLISGLAFRSRALRNGQRQITALIIPGDICDLHGCLHSRSDYTVKAAAGGVVAEVPRSVVLDWIETRSAIAREFLRSSMQTEAMLREWLVNTGHRSASQRISHFFCELIVRLQPANLSTRAEIELPLSQSEIGEITGLSLVHVNRTLQNLRGDGLICLDKRRLVIPDLHRLKRHALFEPEYLCSVWPAAGVEANHAGHAVRRLHVGGVHPSPAEALPADSERPSPMSGS